MLCDEPNACYFFLRGTIGATHSDAISNVGIPLASSASAGFMLIHTHVTATDPKSCPILNIWPVGVQVSTWQAIHHGIVSRKDLNVIAAIPLRIALLLTLQVRSDLKPYSSRRSKTSRYFI